MTDDPGKQSRDRFRATRVAPSPVRISERHVAVPPTAGHAPASRSRFGRGQTIVALAALVAVGSIGVLISGGGTKSPSANPDVTVTLTLATPPGDSVSLTVQPSDNGPTATINDPVAGQSTPPDETGGPSRIWFHREDGAELPVGAGAEIWSLMLSQRDRALRVVFEDDGCMVDYDPWVGLEGDTLLVTIVVVAREEPLPGGSSCPGIALRHTYHLGLPEPFNGSIAKDPSNGQLLQLERA
jgi:hypothetical protein